MVMDHSGSKLKKYSENRTINMCSLMVRVDGDELEVPLNFGMTSEEIRQIYPFILQFASVKMQNPSVQFMEDRAKGIYADENLRKDAEKKADDQAKYWYGQPEASVMELAVRFALDIKLRGIQELIDIFSPAPDVSILDRTDIPEMSNEDVDKYAMEMGIETDEDMQYDIGGEQDIPIGIAGDLSINVYGSQNDDYISDELDNLERKFGEHYDRFSDVVDSPDTNDVSGYTYSGVREDMGLSNDERHMPDIYGSSESLADDAFYGEGRVLDFDTEDDDFYEDADSEG